MTLLVNSLKDNVKRDDSSAGVTSGSTLKTTKLTKLGKDMSLETYSKQIVTWTDFNEDVPEYVKYYDFIEELKKNKEIKGIQKYVAEHILRILT